MVTTLSIITTFLLSCWEKSRNKTRKNTRRAWAKQKCFPSNLVEVRSKQNCFKNNLERLNPLTPPRLSPIYHIWSFKVVYWQKMSISPFQQEEDGLNIGWVAPSRNWWEDIPSFLVVMETFLITAQGPVNTPRNTFSPETFFLPFRL